MTKFEVGKTYATRSIGDYDCIFTFTVLSRTAKFVTLRTTNDEEMRRGVRTSPVFPNTEVCDPFGRYSMSPVLIAERHLVTEEVPAS